MGIRRALPAILLAALAVFLPSPPAARAAEPAAQPEIREIVITGARLVETATVRARIQSREGAPYDPEQVSRDVRAIYDLGYFDNISVDAAGFEGGIRLTFTLTEKPILRGVTFEGNKELETKDLQEKAALPLHTAFSATAVADAVARVKAFYREKGYYQALVRTRTEPGGTGQVSLVIVIEEGEKYRLVKISFRGNHDIAEDELRGEIKTAEWNFLFSPFTSSGKLQQEQLQDDRQRVMTYYQDHGYLEARVGEPEVTVKDKEREIEIVIPVTEGPRYNFGTLQLQGDDLVPLEEIRTFLALQSGEVFRRSAFARAIDELERRYTRRGYAYVRVETSSRLHPDNRTIDITLIVDRGQQARFGRITITGNVTTRDKVIRRELTFTEGDLYDSGALGKSQQKIQNLGFFDTVNINSRPGPEGRIDIDIDVKEHLTGMISLGVGYSTEDRLTGQLKISENNFLGYGQTLALQLEYSPIRKSYALTFTEPAIFDSKNSVSVSIFDLSRDLDTYDRTSIGGRISLGRSLFEYTRGFITLKREKVTVENITADATSYIRAQEGTLSTNSVRLSLVRDGRDSFFNPTRGNRTAVSGEVGFSGLGGDNSFTKFELEHSYYQPLFWKLVGMIHGQYGVVRPYGQTAEPTATRPDQLPIYEKYFLGGILTLRGFPSRGVGPLDENGEPKGAYQQLFFNVETIVPLAPEQGLNLVFFFDTGNGWDKGESVKLGGLRKSAGIGIRWISPIGPFRLEWGKILDRKEGEDSSDWGFMIGNFF